MTELTDALENSAEGVSYTQILEKVRFNFKDLEHLCFWDAETHSKINIGNGTNYELVLICWEKEQESTIHNHNKEGAFTYVLKGEITEKNYQSINGSGKFNFKGEAILVPKTITSLQKRDGNYHQLSNSYDGRSVSLHLYVK